MRHSSSTPQGKIRAALETLVKKLEQIHADPAYQGVWTIYQTHCGPYRGPQYADELQKAREALNVYERPLPPALGAKHLPLETVVSERADIVVAASDKDEPGWLVELPRHSAYLNKTVLWWAGGGIKPHQVFDEPVWTLDALKAVRFCRKEDAIKAIASWEEIHLIKEVKILEHLFLKG